MTQLPSANPSPLRLAAFREFWLAVLLSNFGLQVQIVAAAWMMVTIAGTPQLVALVQAAVSLPVALFALPGGAIADNMDVRRVMLVSQGLMLLLSCMLAAWAALGGTTPYPLIGFVFLIATCGAIFTPAWFASVREIVPRSAISGAVALNSAGFNLARAFGPAVGGLLIALGGVAVAFAVAVTSYVGIILALVRWRPERPVSALPREGLLHASMAGIQYAGRAQHVRTAMLASVITCVPGGATFALLPIVAHQQLGGGPVLYGTLLGAFGGGAILGAAIGVRLRGSLSPTAVISCANLLQLLSLLALGASGVRAIAMAGAVLGGIGWVVANSTINTVVQLVTPKWVAARTLGIVQASAFGAMAAGSWVIGSLAEWTSAGHALLVTAGLLVAGLGVGARLRHPKLQEADIEPVSIQAEFPVALPIGPADGPITVEARYRVRRRDVPAFRRLIAEHERMCRRDGARSWTLLRDLGDSCVWIERYVVRSWADYQRYAARRTRGDQQRVAALAGFRDPDAAAAAQYYWHVRSDEPAGASPGMPAHDI